MSESGSATPTIHPAVEQHNELARDWEGKYAKRSFASRERWIENCLDQLPLGQTQWLDAGCGTGRLSRLLARKGCRVKGVDAAQSMLDVAAELARNDGLQESLSFEHVQTVETLPFGDGTFDGILCSSVIEYLDNPQRCVAEFSRLLRPGGWLVLTAPNRSSLIRRMLRWLFTCTRRIGRPWPRYMEVSRNEFSPDSLRSVLARHGLVAEQVSFLGGPLPGWLQRRRLFGPLLLVLARKDRA